MGISLMVWDADGTHGTLLFYVTCSSEQDGALDYLWALLT